MIPLHVLELHVTSPNVKAQSQIRRIMLIDMFCLLALRLAEKSGDDDDDADDDDDDDDSAQQEELCVFLISALTNLSFLSLIHISEPTRPY